MIPMNAPLVGFGGTRVLPLGAVTLFIVVGDYPQQIKALIKQGKLQKFVKKERVDLPL